MMKSIFLLMLISLNISCSHTGSQHDLGTLHQVEAGETIWSISRDYRVPIKEIIDTNNIKAPDKILAGQSLIVPVEDESLLLRWIHTPIQCHKNNINRRKKHASKNSHLTHRLFTWPVRGTISSFYGPRDGRLHQGIDIAAKSGTRVRAASDGTVIFAGELKGYGKTVIMQHKGYRTLYAHCSQILVTKGEPVRKGFLIAKVGSTGRSTGPHLHFEIQRGLTSVNPLKHLGYSLVKL